MKFLPNFGKIFEKFRAAVTRVESERREMASGPSKFRRCAEEIGKEREREREREGEREEDGKEGRERGKMREINFR